MDLLLESLTNDKVVESGGRAMGKTFTGPHSHFRGSQQTSLPLFPTTKDRLI
jgi:hypothetical protein